MNKDIVTVEQPKEGDYFAKGDLVWFEESDMISPLIKIDYDYQKIRIMDMNDE